MWARMPKAIFPTNPWRSCKRLESGCTATAKAFTAAAKRRWKNEYGRITQKGDHLYYHVMEPMVGYIPLTGLPVDRIESVRLLRDGSELPIIHDWITDNYETLPYVTLGPDPHLPDPVDTVLDVKLRG